MAAGLVGSALACAIALSVQAPAPTQQETATELRVKATNEALLEALVMRRAEVARSASAVEDKAYALDFLDRRIAELRSRARK